MITMDKLSFKIDDYESFTIDCARIMNDKDYEVFKNMILCLNSIIMDDIERGKKQYGKANNPATLKRLKNRVEVVLKIINKNKQLEIE